MSGRLSRVRRGLWPAAQTALAAALAWWIARRTLSEPRPLFAPIVAVIALGFTTGQRGRAAVQIVLGVAIGVAVADVVAHYVGAGGLQIAAVVFVAMIVGLLVGTSSTFVVQAAVTGLIVAAAYHPGADISPARLLEAVVGGAVALVFSQVLFPVDPVDRSRQAAGRLLDAMADALEEGEANAGAKLPGLVRELDEAVHVAVQAARLAPTRRRAAGTVGRYRDARPRLALAAASTASFGRIAGRAEDDGSALHQAAAAVAAVARRTERALAAGDDGSAARALAVADRRIRALPQEPLTNAAARLTLEAIAAELAAAAGLETP